MPEPAPTLDLAAIEARANAATTGPWTATIPGCDHALADVLDFAGCPVSICMGADPTHWTGYDTPDAAFIAHAREDIPTLVARVRALEEFVLMVRLYGYDTAVEVLGEPI